MFRKVMPSHFRKDASPHNFRGGSLRSMIEFFPTIPIHPFLVAGSLSPTRMDTYSESKAWGFNKNDSMPAVLNVEGGLGGLGKGVC